MYLLRYVFICALTVFGFNNANADVKVIYINGALNLTLETATSSFQRFQQIFTENKIQDLLPTRNCVGSIFQCKSITAELFYLPESLNPLSSAPIEILFQETMSDTAIKEAISNSAYELQLGKLYHQEFSKYSTPDSYPVVLKKTKGLVDKIVNEIQAGNEIIIVSHSQGNLFAEAAIAYIASRYQGTLLDRHIRHVGLASPTYLNRSGRYITLSVDKTVYTQGGVGAWRLYGPGVLYKPQDANIEACAPPCMNSLHTSFDYLKDYTNDSRMHGAVKVYFNNSIVDLKSGKSVVEILVDYLRKSTSELTLKSSIKRISVVSPNLAHASKYQIWIDRAMQIFGVRTAWAEIIPNSLSGQLESTVTIFVEGDSFDGTERVLIDRQACSTNSYKVINGGFTQNCLLSGISPGEERIRVSKSDTGVELFIPSGYNFFALKSPVLAPLAPQLSDFGGGSIHINWNGIYGATGYIVVRNGLDIATVGAVTSFSDPFIHPLSTQVCYRLKAISGKMLSSYSPEQCLTTSGGVSVCTNQWTPGTSSVGITESGSQTCPAGQTGSITLAHTCAAGGVWTATTQTANTCRVGTPTSCTNSWTSGTTGINSVESRTLACPNGQSGSILESQTCLATGQFGTLSPHGGRAVA
jgi:hypothetical protein